MLRRRFVPAAEGDAEQELARLGRRFGHGRAAAGVETDLAEAAVALELSESIEKLLLDDFDDEC